MHTIDDRGRSIRLERLPAGTPTRAEALPERIDAMQQERMSRATRVGCGAYAFLAVLLVMIAGGEVFNRLSMSCGIHITFLVLLIGSAAYLTRRIWRIDAIQHLRALGVCASCGYRIGDLTAAADGCTVLSTAAFIAHRAPWSYSHRLPVVRLHFHDP